MLFMLSRDFNPYSVVFYAFIAQVGQSNAKSLTMSLLRAVYWSQMPEPTIIIKVAWWRRSHLPWPVPRRVPQFLWLLRHVLALLLHLHWIYRCLAAHLSLAGIIMQWLNMLPAVLHLRKRRYTSHSIRFSDVIYTHMQENRAWARWNVSYFLPFLKN